MQARQRFDRLNLDDKPILDQQIEAIAGFNDFAVVNDGKGFLSREAHPKLFKFTSEAMFVDAFEQPRTKQAMDFQSSADHRP